MKKTFLVVVSLFTIVFSSCDFPEVKPVLPDKEFTEMLAKLCEPEKFENARVITHANTVNGVTANSVEVILLNGKYLPENPDSLHQLAKNKAKIAVDALDNSEDYKEITVNIKTENNSALINKSTERTFTFFIEELRKKPASEQHSLQKDSLIVPPAPAR